MPIKLLKVLAPTSRTGSDQVDFEVSARTQTSFSLAIAKWLPIRKASWFIGLAGIVFVLSFANAQDEKPIRAKLDQAKSDYEAEMAKCRKEMTDSFDKKEVSLRKAGKKDLLDKLKLEREAFDKEGELPIVVPTLAYTQKSRQARHALDKAFRQSIKECLKAKLDEQAAKIETEFKEFLAASGNDWMRPGEVLSVGDSLISKAARYEFVLQTDGNLVLFRLVPTKAVVWASGTQGKGVSNCVLQRDGNLILKSKLGRVIWASGSSGHALGKLTLQDDGNAVIYNRDGAAIWSTKSSE